MFCGFRDNLEVEMTEILAGFCSIAKEHVQLVTNSQFNTS